MHNPSYTHVLFISNTRHKGTGREKTSLGRVTGVHSKQYRVIFELVQCSIKGAKYLDARDIQQAVMAHPKTRIHRNFPA